MEEALLDLISAQGTPDELETLLKTVEKAVEGGHQNMATKLTDVVQKKYEFGEIFSRFGKILSVATLDLIASRDAPPGMLALPWAVRRLFHHMVDSGEFNQAFEFYLDNGLEYEFDPQDVEKLAQTYPFRLRESSYDVLKSGFNDAVQRAAQRGTYSKIDMLILHALTTELARRENEPPAPVRPRKRAHANDELSTAQKKRQRKIPLPLPLDDSSSSSSDDNDDDDTPPSSGVIKESPINVEPRMLTHAESLKLSSGKNTVERHHKRWFVPRVVYSEKMDGEARQRWNLRPFEAGYIRPENWIRGRLWRQTDTKCARCDQTMYRWQTYGAIDKTTCDRCRVQK